MITISTQSDIKPFKRRGKDGWFLFPSENPPVFREKSYKPSVSNIICMPRPPEDAFDPNDEEDAKKDAAGRTDSPKSEHY
jgi:hypothetical protein